MIEVTEANVIEEDEIFDLKQPFQCVRLEFDIENPLIVVPTGPESIDISHFVIDLGQMTVKSSLIN